MGISIKTNVTSLKAQQNLNATNSMLQENIEKLSTGYRINTAADDAAGLAVSEEMEADIRSLRQAKRNANDAVSMMQTAEGAMGEIHDLMGRMRELSVQANSDAINATQRSHLQKEIAELNKELTDIAENATYNGQSLLDGSLDASFQVSKDANDLLKIDVDQDFAASQLRGDIAESTNDVSTALTSSSASGGSSTLDGDGNGTTDDYIDTSSVADLDASDFEKGQIVQVSDGTNSVEVEVTDIQGDKVLFKDDTLSSSSVDLSTTTTTSAGNSVEFKTQTVSQLDISTRDGAKNASASVDDIISSISSERAKVGAVLNRAEVKIDNISVQTENLEAANSRIRDVDVASEMAKLTKNRILKQAGSAMLAQANQMPQTAAQLIGG